MQSRSFKYALRATIRACLVAASTASTVYADWNAPTLTIPVTCMVHDSGLEFLPIQFHPIDPAAHDDRLFNQSPASRENSLPSLANTPSSTQLDQCVALAERRDRLDQLMAAELWIQNFGRRTMSVVSQGALQITRIQGQLLAQWNQNTPTILDHLAEARRTTEAAHSPALAFDPTLGEDRSSQEACFPPELPSSLASSQAIASLPSDVERTVCEPIHAEIAQSDPTSATQSPTNHSERCIGSSDVDMASLCPARSNLSDESGIPNASDAFGILPSGQTANLFVFTLSGNEPSGAGDEPSGFDAVDRSTDQLIAVIDESNGIDGIDATIESADTPAYRNDDAQDFAPCNDIESELAGEVALTASEPMDVNSLGNASMASPEVVSTQSPEAFVADARFDSEPATNESELCLPLSCRVSQCGPGTDQSLPSSTPATVPPQSQSPDNASSSQVDVVSGWRTLFRPDSCIFGPELAAANSVLFGGPNDLCGPNELATIEPDRSDTRPPTLEIPNDEPISALGPGFVHYEGDGNPRSADPTHWYDLNIPNSTDNESSVRFTHSTWLGIAPPATELANTASTASSEPPQADPSDPPVLADEAKHQALGVEQLDAPEPGFVAIASNPIPIGNVAPSLPAIAPLESLDPPSIPSIESGNPEPIAAEPIAVDQPAASLDTPPPHGNPTESIDALPVDPNPAPTAPLVSPFAESDPIDYPLSDRDVSLDSLPLADGNESPQSL